MRLHTSAQRELHRQPNRNYHVRVEVQDLDLNWKNLKNLFAVNWIDNWTVDYNLDNQVATASVDLMRETRNFSLAPLMGGSDINRLADDSYSPLLWPARPIRILTATTESGVAPLEEEWIEIFIGRIDEINWANDPVTIQARDEGGRIQDAYIKEVVTYENDPHVPLEDQIETLLAPMSPAVPLFVPVPTDAEIGGYTQDLMNRMEAIQNLAILSGLTARYKYADDGVSKFTLYEPDRTKTVADDIFGPSEYFSVNNLNIALTDIRNYVEVFWKDSSGEEHSTVRTDPTSMAAFGERYMSIGLEATKNLITTEPEAIRLAEAARNELAFPYAVQEIENSYYPYAELGDYYEWIANNQHYDSNQKFAVAAFRHEGRGGDITTTITTRGKPAAYRKRWFRLESGQPNDAEPLDITVPPVLTYSVNLQSQWLTAKVQGGPGTYVTRALCRIDREPTAIELDASLPSPPGYTSGIFTDLIKLKAGKRFYVAGRAYNAAGEGTAVARIEGEWLGLNATPGADVILGTPQSGTKFIIWPTAFDDECAYCHIWIREYDSEPTLTSVEGRSPAPFRTLTLGTDAMMPGVAVNVAIPISHPDNWLVVTWVPFDHLDKRGHPQTRKMQGSQGVPGTVTNPYDPPTVEPSLAVWIDPSQEDTFNNDDRVATGNDFSGEDNDAVAVASGFRPLYKTNQTPAGDAVFRFASVNGNGNFGGDADTPANAGEPEYLVTPLLGIPNDGMTIIVAGRRSGAHVEHTAFYRLATIGGNSDLGLSETHNIPDNTHLYYGINGTVIAESVTTDWFIHAVRFSSLVAERTDFYEGVEHDTVGNPAQATAMNALLIGAGGEVDIADIQLFLTDLDDTKIAERFAWLDWKLRTPHDHIPVGDPPLQITALEQVDSFVDSVTVRVTLPDPAPPKIKISIDGIRGFTVDVTGAPLGTQDIIVPDLDEGMSYTICATSVSNSGLLPTASPPWWAGLPLCITGTTDISGGTLDDIVSVEAAYDAAGQNILVRIETTGLNHPNGTIYHAEISPDNNAGPYAGDYVGFEDGFGALISIPFAQPSSSYPFLNSLGNQTVYVRVWASRNGWIDSGKFEFAAFVHYRPS